MNCKRRPLFYFIVPVIVQVLTGCNVPKETEFSFIDAERNVIPVMAYSTEAAAGLLDLRRSKKYTYSLQQLLPLNSNTSLEIDYTLDYTGSADVLDFCKIIVKLDDKSSWELPLDYSFLGLKVNSNRNKYLIPINSQSIQNVIFSIVYKNNNGKKDKKNKLAVQINSLKLSKRAYGFEKTEDCILTTPFVFLDKSTAEIKNSYINPLSKYKIEGRADIILSGYNKNSTIGINGANDIKYRFYTNDDSKFKNNITIPYIFSNDDDYPVILSGDADTFLLCGADGAKDLNADPRVILNYPKELWRNKDYEYFTWDIFPSILIFDTINYDVQDRLFKRLAFFSEKKGFRGRLARDEEIASLHGWNAHDYNSKSLVNFFNAVKKNNFPISNEEKKLHDILLSANIIKLTNDKSEYIEGEGAILSISRESPEYLRSMFMVHEGFHGIYFIDDEFRKFCKDRWDHLNVNAKRFIVSYFDYQQYDINDEYIILNEFMAHCLQQPVSGAAKYFGETLAARIDASEWRRSVLPAKDEEKGNWPLLADAFKAEAAAFSEYVSSRWGLSAGRLWRIRVIQPDQD